jgi:hypothetical protein
MTLEGVLGMTGIVGIIALVIMVGFWFALTVFILCIMEVRIAISVCWVYRSNSWRVHLLRTFASKLGSLGVFARTASPLG